MTEMKEDIFLGKYKYLTIPIQPEMYDYLNKYNALLLKYSDSNRENESKGFTFILPEYSSIIRTELIELNEKFKKAIVFRDEQALSILN